ncbi:LysR family transcriptional regulator [Roseovarius aestuariivivens]|uniref:LysR family transcriptional regulator n=1 Tax=Roseovarius aestuariivivens TaxID=1888910 RepID=UPI0010822851|nr:LysR family transcriptional regulator [Roseovarius aestuariivivens]
MDITDELRAFVTTAKTGSFTAAADQLGVSNRLTSKYVAELEHRLGVRLLQRTTRKVGLTPAGEDLLARAPALLDELDDLLQDVSEGSRGLTGMIRVSAPVTFGEAYVGRMLGRFAAQHPGLTFDIRLSDGFVDLASDGIDLAFRIGQSDMLSLKTRKLGAIRSIAVASLDYLARHGAPSEPADLAHHDCILDTNRRTPRRWIFFKQGQDIAVQVKGSFQLNSARAAVELAADGLGICYAPHFALRDELQTGTLVPVLEEFEGLSVEINAVYLEGRAMPRKIRALIDFAVEDIRQSGTL